MAFQNTKDFVRFFIDLPYGDFRLLGRSFSSRYILSILRIGNTSKVSIFVILQKFDLFVQLRVVNAQK